MKNAQFSLSCTLLGVAVANFVVSLIVFLKDAKGKK